MRIKVVVIAFIALMVVISGMYLIIYIAANNALHLPRQAILKTPADYGLSYENIEFPSTDGIPLKGWWIPGSSKAVIFTIHGYGANRVGWVGKSKDGKDEVLNWLEAVIPLNKAGYNLVYFDLRACGESGGEKITFGKYEVNDLMGAVNWFLENKSQSGSEKIDRIGLLGFSMGGNVALRGGIELKELVNSGKISAAAVIAIGPYIYDTMMEKQFWSGLPSFFSFVIPIQKQCSGLAVGFNPSKELNPTKYVNQISPIPIMFIQSEKDEIGDVSDVKAMYEKAGQPKEIIILPNAPRFEHYKYPIEKPERVLEFYRKYLLEN